MTKSQKREWKAFGVFSSRSPNADCLAVRFDEANARHYASLFGGKPVIRPVLITLAKPKGKT